MRAVDGVLQLVFIHVEADLLAVHLPVKVASEWQARQSLSFGFCSAWSE